MNTYSIEHHIKTLAQNAVPNKKNKTYNSFSFEKINFEHKDFNLRDGWLGHTWVARGVVHSEDFGSAINIFRKKLRLIIPRIALIAQSYIDFRTEPFLVHKEGAEVAFFHCVKNGDPGGLMFMEGEREALTTLFKDRRISDEFYYYWNDAVNTLGYPAKLLLMFSALEALAKSRDDKLYETKYDFYNHILGAELADTVFKQKTGLRHRLVHGDYFIQEEDEKNNYLDLIHKKVMLFFNKEILKDELLSEDVVAPQRHFYDNVYQWAHFVERVDSGDTFNLDSILSSTTDDLLRVELRDGSEYKLTNRDYHNNLINDY